MKKFEMVIKKRFITQMQNWDENLLIVTFESKYLDTKKNRLEGIYHLEFKGIEAKIDGFYEIGGDIRSDLKQVLGSRLEILKIFNGTDFQNDTELQNEEILYNQLLKILPIYKVIE